MKIASHKNIAYTQAGKFEETRFEKIHNIIFKDSNEASILVAQEIANLIREKEGQNKPCVLGLATGSSPIKVYEELIRIHKEEGLSFANVITFNLDEYYPMDKNNIQSYFYFMHEHLFNHVDILPENINIPDGKISAEDLYQYCIDRLNDTNITLDVSGLDEVVGLLKPLRDAWQAMPEAAKKEGLDLLKKKDQQSSVGA